MFIRGNRIDSTGMKLLAEIIRIESMVRSSRATAGNSANKLASSSPSSALKPIAFALHQNYPNPFNPSTTIKYELPVDTHVTLNVFDILGREVLTLTDENKQAGYHRTELNATSFASGVYFYRLQAGTFSQTNKLILLR
jgi:hypothetical protein